LKLGQNTGDAKFAEKKQTQEVVKTNEYKTGDTVMVMSRSLGKDVPWKVISGSPKEGYSITRQMDGGKSWSAPRKVTQDQISGKIVGGSIGSEDIRGTIAV